MPWIGRVVAAALAGAVVSATAAQDAVQWRVEDGGNGHWYRAFVPGGEWTVGRHAAFAAQSGATLASFGSPGEREAVQALLAEQLAEIPSEELVMVHAIGRCDDCQAYWRGNAAITDGWASGEPTQWPGHFIAWARPRSLDLVSDTALEPGSWAIWEWEEDCNENGVVDYGEIADGLVADSNGNWVPDSCDIHAAANLITNGSFEANPVNQCCTSASGWVGSIDLVWVEWFAYDGGISIDLNPGGTGTIRQDVVIDQPGTYRLSFAMAGNSCGASPSLKEMRVSLGSFSEEFEHQLAGDVELAEGWSRFSREIELDAGIQPLVFESLVGGCGGPALDAISLRLLADCNRDGEPDIDQVRRGELDDEDGDGVPDCCEGACAGDLNGDDTVGPPDLGILLAVWGTDGGKIERADINEDGTVDAVDLGFLIAAWGDCGCN